MKKNVFIAQARMSILRRLYVVALTAVMATLAAMAQTSDAGGNDRIAQLEKEMYRYYSSNAIDSFMLITDQLIEADRGVPRGWTQSGAAVLQGVVEPGHLQFQQSEPHARSGTGPPNS